MNQTPTVLETLQRGITLFAESFLPMLPFLVVMVAVSLGLNWFFPPDAKGEPSWINIILDLVLGTLMYSFIIYGVYQKYHLKTVNYSEVLERGFSRFLPVIGFILLLLIPAIVIGIIGVIIWLGLAAVLVGGGQPLLPGVAGIPISILITFGLLGLLFMWVYAYLFVAMVLIVAKKVGPWDAIQQSIKMTKGSVMKTLAIILIYCIIAGALAYGAVMLGAHFLTQEQIIEIVKLVTTPLGCALMVVQHANLEANINVQSELVNKQLK